jgi:hypothetical protein
MHLETKPPVVVERDLTSTAQPDASDYFCFGGLMETGETRDMVTVCAAQLLKIFGHQIIGLISGLAFFLCLCTPSICGCKFRSGEPLGYESDKVSVGPSQDTINRRYYWQLFLCEKSDKVKRDV